MQTLQKSPSTPAAEQIYRIQGMDCANCAMSVEKGVAQLPGVDLCALSFTTEKLRVTGSVTEAEVVERVSSLGYQAVRLDGAAAFSAHKKQGAPNFWAYLWSRLETRFALLGALLILPGLIGHELLGMDSPLIDLLSVGALAAAGWPIARSGLRSALINREITINVLMVVAAVGAVIIGAFTEAGMVMVLFALGEALEGYTADQARNAIRSLMEVVPNQAILIKAQAEGSQEISVSVTELRVGDLILVRPGDRVPMDGEVIRGNSAVDQSAITGESRLVPVTPGDAVLASSINSTGALEVRVTRLAADNTIARLVQMVEEAQEKRAPTQRFVDRFAKVYTPLVMLIAGLVAIVPPLFFSQPFWNPGDGSLGWFYRALALLVVACPCALVISVPVTVISAISNGAGRGILFKGGAYLERMSQIKAFALDKTGTLTEGSPSVVIVRAAACQNGSQGGSCGPCDDLLSLASSVERRSEHPLARAILDAARQQGVLAEDAALNVVALSGQGITGQVNGRQVTVGSHAYFDGRIAHAPAICQAAEMDAAQGYTPLMVSRDDEYMGTITVGDRVRPSSREAVALLRQQGTAVIMLTGDNPATAQVIGEEVGVTDVRAGLLPAEKLAAIQALQAEYGPVAMVGDGINDAPALAAADVGIAMGGAFGGTNQAMESGDVTLMSDDLRQLPFALGLSRAAQRTIWVNVAASIGVKLIFFLLVLAGLGTMWMAVLSDMGTSLLVTLNGMRMLKWRG
jgi:Cd2+/Zn2+-exporting ATPase